MRFLTGVSHVALMRPDDGAGAGTAESDAAAAAAAAAAAGEGGAAGDPGQGEGGGAPAAGAGDGAAAAAAATGDKPKPAEPEKPAPTAPAMPKWAKDRIAEETNKRRDTAAALERAESEKRALQELVERLQKGNGGAGGGEGASPAATAAAVETAAARIATPDPRKYEADVLAGAERLRFNDDCNAIFQSGTAEFKDFEDAVGVLNAANVMQDDFLMDVLAADRPNAHKIIHDLAKDPEKARKLVGMPTRQRLAELVRMTATAGAAPPKRETNTPPPIVPKVDAVTTADPNDFGDKISDDDWSARWDKKYLKSA